MCQELYQSSNLQGRKVLSFPPEVGFSSIICRSGLVAASEKADFVHRLMRAKMEEMEVYQDLKIAPHKSIFLTADPKLIIYQEASRLVGSNGDYDFFLQKIRDSFRCSFRLSQETICMCQEIGPVLP